MKLTTILELFKMQNLAQGSKVEQLVGARELREEFTGSNATWAILDYPFIQLTWVIQCKPYPPT